jgi:hypothetical protein
MPGFKKISTRQARARRPKELGSVEPELQVPPPRPKVWEPGRWSTARHTRKTEKLLVHGGAARAWVTAYSSERDGEGTDHFVQFAFEVKGKLVQGKFIAGYDDLHLSYGSPDYDSWLKKAFHKKGTFTVLYNPKDPSEHVIYGTLEPFLKKTLLEVAREIVRSKDPIEVDRLARQFLDIALAPLGGVKGEWEEYYKLLGDIGLYVGEPGATYQKNLAAVKHLFHDGWVDRALLSRLSSICKRYWPGVWAAT